VGTRRRVGGWVGAVQFGPCLPGRWRWWIGLALEYRRLRGAGWCRACVAASPRCLVAECHHQLVCEPKTVAWRERATLALDDCRGGWCDAFLSEAGAFFDGGVREQDFHHSTRGAASDEFVSALV